MNTNITSGKITFNPISPNDALMRSQQYPSTCIIGPSGVGKTAFVNAVFNNNFSKVLKIGVGDKNQTTLFTSNFVLDSRIPEDQFALKIFTKDFDFKRVTTIVVDAVYELFCKKDYCTEDTLEDMDKIWFFNHIIEPAKATYRLNAISNHLDLPIFKDSVFAILKKIETDSDGNDFEDLLKERKKDPALKSFKATEIKQQLFTSLWHTQSEDTQSKFNQWLSFVEKLIWKNFNNFFDYTQKDRELLLEGSIEKSEHINVLTNIFDPKAPYSLITQETYLACRPNEELFHSNPYEEGHPPFRLCLRDTVGVNQSANDPESIREGIEIGLNYQANSILILLNLEDREDVLKPFCTIIRDQLKKRSPKQRVLLKVLFTKGDKLIGTRIAQKADTLIIGQENYNAHIVSSIEEVETKVSQLAEILGESQVNWLSLRYHKTEDDPIQKAMQEERNIKQLQEMRETKRLKFMAQDAFDPSSLYHILEQTTKEALDLMLPPGMTTPHFVSVKEPNKPVIKLTINTAPIIDRIENLKTRLTQDKMVVNSYLFPSKPIKPNFLQISPWSVNAYWYKLPYGMGHVSKSDPGKYLNINVNMKGLLYRLLAENLNLSDLYNLKAFSTTAHGLNSEDSNGDLNELEAILRALGVDDQQKEDAFRGWNPALENTLTSFKRYEQILHCQLREYFLDKHRQHQVLDKVALQLTFGNYFICQKLQAAYNEQYSHDLSFRRVQDEFYQLFSSDEFNKLLAEEISSIMTDMVNKLFIAV